MRGARSCFLGIIFLTRDPHLVSFGLAEAQAALHFSSVKDKK